jgi:hypothetical protein
VPLDVDSPEFGSVVHERLAFCMKSFSIRHPHFGLKEKHLLDLSRLVDSHLAELSPECQAELVGMLLANIDRPNLHFPSRSATDSYTIPVCEATWGCLRICYKMVKALIQKVPHIEMIDFRVVRRFLFLAQVPDKEERCEIANILGLYFDTRPAERWDLLTAVSHQLALLREVSLVPYCGSTLLMVLHHMFTQGSAEFRPAVVSVIANTAIPLVTSPDVAIFYPVLRTLVMDFVAMFPGAGLGVLKRVQQLWPLTSGAKEALFVNLVIHVALILDQADFAPIAVSFFRFIGALFRSPNFLVMDQLLSALDRPDGRAFLAAHRELVAQYIADAVADLPTGHWSHDVRTKATAVLPGVLGIVAGLRPAAQPAAADVPTLQRWAPIIRAAQGQGAGEIPASA